MSMISVLVACLPGLVLAAALLPAAAQTRAEDEAMLLVASPAVRDPDYRQAVLLVAPAQGGGHVGVIINRPTRHSLARLFPEHEPSKRVVEPVFYGGPFNHTTLVALVRAEVNPGRGSVQIMRNLFLAFQANTIDRVIETTPNEARYYVGHVGWRPGELKRELERGFWTIVDADLATVFRKDTDGLWEELLAASRRLRTGAPLWLAGARHDPAP